MKLVDLTQPLSPQTARSSDHPEVEFPVLRWFSRNGIKTRKIVASLHSGTHVDAPSMYFHDGASIDQLPLEGFCGEGVVVDVSLGPWGVISSDVLDERASEVGEGDILALWTDWGRHYLDEETYILHPPGLDKSGVDWLVRRKVKAIFSDTPSSEHIFMRNTQWRQLRPDIFAAAEFDPADFPSAYGHKTLLPAGIMMVENLSEELGSLVGRRVTLMALPMKYQGVEAAPARVVAITELP
jgi:kynurenine formamidase